MTIREKACVLFALDLAIREHVSDEDQISRWLMLGVPDGCTSPLDIEGMMLLDGPMDCYPEVRALGIEILKKEGIINDDH